LIAEEQTAGRGRLDRSWLSPRGGIWMTILLRPPNIFAAINGLPLIGALAIAKSVSSTLGVNSRVRWPNDVVANNRKFAGVLAETKITGNRMEYVLLGMGINANFDPSLIQETDATSTSLLGLLGSPVDREALVCSLLMEAEQLYELFSANRDDEVMKMLREFECSRGRHVTIKTEVGIIMGVLEDYDTFTRVRIRTSLGSYKLIETSSVIKVDYTVP
jgi:BirA family biotin operon repressor/biotin-[acetyl-CoA-carboxylase] ligase